MIVAIHQPYYIPWLGFFHKMHNADKFVLLDNVDISKSSKVFNRNKIKTPNGEAYLTIPITSHSCLINECKSADNKWPLKHFKTLKANYSKSPFFKEYEQELKEIFSKEYDKVIDITIPIIRWIAEKFGITTPILINSELDTEGSRNQRNINICKSLGADTYLSGTGAKDYNDEAQFKQENLKLLYQDFTHPVYPQLFGEFIPNLSALDFLFNIGPKASEFFTNNLLDFS